MSAPVLSISEQKSAISGQKKKKKTVKNILGIPDTLTVEPQYTDEDETQSLTEILNRLLPSARLPSKDRCNDSKPDESELQHARNKRSQLALGVNSVNRSIKNESISAVVLAKDIQPKFLFNHLSLMCSHSKIPFLLMSGLRETTKNSLGFPCIAVGFKKDFEDFSEAVQKITSIFKSKELSLKNNTTEEPIVETSDSEEDEITENCSKPEEPFTYLYRTSNKERVFIPEEYNTELQKKKSETDFIIIKDEDVVMDAPSQGISSNLIRKQQKNSIVQCQSKDDDDDDDDEELEVPKKKKKKDWVIDTVGERKTFKYSAAKLHRVPSNPNRKSKKE